jgi:folate-binding protein YgfZ
MIQPWQTFLNEHSFSPLKHKAGVLDLSYLGLLKITGEDAKKFLQGQLTCNLDEISVSQTRLGAHCNPKGRIISLFRFFYFHDSFYLQMPREMISIAMQALKKYAVFFKVQLHDASDELICLGFIGDQLNQFISALPKKSDESAEIDDLFIINMSNKKIRYAIFGNIVAISSLWKKISSNIPLISSNQWKYEDIASKLAQIYPETSEKFLPHELDLHQHNGISFNKGCYTGQEIIARMHYRGKLKTQLQHILIKSDFSPERGKDLEQTQNTIVDFCKKDDNHYELLIITQE